MKATLAAAIASLPSQQFNKWNPYYSLSSWKITEDGDDAERF
jgi:hypothetical protein